MASKVKIKRTKTSPEKRVYDVSLSALTAGEIFSIINSLEARATGGSLVAKDVLGYFKKGIKESGDEWIKDIA